MPIPLTAFVAGASGYTGRAVVTALRAAGLRPIAHVRPASAGPSAVRFEAAGVEVDRTAWAADAMREALTRHRPDLVFALLGTTRRRAAAEGIADPYERVDYALTAVLHAAAVACGTRPRFVYLSAMGADERSRNRYLAVRGRFERELREGPLPWLVAQPAFVTGRDREEFRLGERVGAAAGDLLLRALGLAGLGAVRDRFASLDGTRLARGLVTLALEARDGRRTVGPGELRHAGRL